MGGQGGCERRIEVIVNRQKSRMWGSGRGDKGGFEQRIKVIVNMQNKSGVGTGGRVGGGAVGGAERSGMGVRVDVNKEF